MSLPKIALLTTGGTIAGAADAASGPDGYTAGNVAAEALLAAVPQARERADIVIEPCLTLDSKNMAPNHWLTIAQTARNLIAREDVTGLVVTHGTDTLEETALFLELLLPAAKPVVVTGAMRPADAVSADGPANLLDAVRVAISPAAQGRGTLVCFAEHILPARGLRKAHATGLDAFAAQYGPVGSTRPEVRFFRPPAPRPELLPWPDADLPRVDTVHVAAGTAPEWLGAARGLGAKGIVLALPGNGSVPDAWCEAIRALTLQGVPVVRATRCGQGFVAHRRLDVELGTLAAGRLGPAQARVALMLALAAEDAAAFSRVALTTHAA
jgi:L-asparaginase